MKTKFKYLLLLTLVACGLASCSNDLDPWADGNHRTMKKKTPSKVYTMKLSLGGDFMTEYDEPLRSEDSPEGNTFVGINIFRTKKESGATEENYGYGVYKFDASSETDKFDKANSSIDVELYSDYTYRFETTVLTEWNDKLAVKNVSGEAYGYPFLTKPNSTNYSGHGADFKSADLNSFHYTYNILNSDGTAIPDDERYRLPYLKSGKAYINHGGDWSYSTSASNFNYPRLKRYYGELNNFDPETTTSDDYVTNATIDLAYQCFGVKILVTGLPAKTKLKVRDKSQPKRVNDYSNEEQDYLLFPKDLVFEHTSTADMTEEQILKKEFSHESLFSLNTLWPSEEMDDATIDKKVKFTLEFEWDRGGGVKETFESSQIEVSPKTRKVIRVTVDGVANTKTDGNIKFNFVDIDETLTEDATVVEVTNKKTGSEGNPTGSEGDPTDPEGTGD